MSTVHPDEQMSNRRVFPRVALQSRCWCETDGITLYARAMNVSEGGVFIRTYAPLDRGVSARVRFNVENGGREIAAEAVVVWTRGETAEPDVRVTPGMALQFVNLDDPGVKALRDYVGRAQLAGSHA